MITYIKQQNVIIQKLSNTVINKMLSEDAQCDTLEGYIFNLY